MVDSPKQESQFKACCITLDWHCMIIRDVIIQDWFWSGDYFHTLICEFHGFSDSWKSSHLIPLSLIFDVLQMSLPSLQVLYSWDWQVHSRMWGEPAWGTGLSHPWITVHSTSLSVSWPAATAGVTAIAADIPLPCTLFHLKDKPFLFKKVMSSGIRVNKMDQFYFWVMCISSLPALRIPLICWWKALTIRVLCIYAQGGVPVAMWKGSAQEPWSHCCECDVIT